MSQPEPQVKDEVDPAAAVRAPDVEERFKGHSKVAENVKVEYQQIYRQMFQSIRADHLQPLVNVVLEHDKLKVQSVEELTETLRKTLRQQLEDSLEVFWEQHDIANALTSLEMLKDKFKEYEGKDWDMQSKTVDQRTLPMRIRFKKMYSRYLQKQLRYQDEQLEEMIKDTNAQRTRIQQITQQRIYLRDTMDGKDPEFDDMATKMQMELLQVQTKDHNAQDVQ